MHTNVKWFAVFISIIVAVGMPATGESLGEGEPQRARPTVQDDHRIRDEGLPETTTPRRELDIEDADDDPEAGEQDERTRWLSRLKRLRTEHSTKLAELRQRKENAEPDADEAIAKDAAEIIGLHEQALGMIEQLRAVLEGEAEEIHLERVAGRFEYLHDFIELRHEILDLSRQSRTARIENDEREAARLQQRIKKLRIRAGLEDLTDPSDDGGGLAGPLELTRDDVDVAARADFEVQIMPLLESYCIDCHGPDTQEGELNFVAELKVRPLVRRRETWDKVIAHLKNRVMPPPDSYEMDDDARRTLAAYFDGAVHHFDYSQVDDPGYEASRRLTHSEYNNTTRDLFGIDLKPTDKFPIELSGTSGFENSGNTLFLHRLLMERYFGAAEEVVAQALPAQSDSDARRRSRAMIFMTEPADASSATVAAGEILGRFLLRAYRRPPTDAELDAAMRQFESSLAIDGDFEEAVKSVIQTVLVSPNFLMRIETRRATDEPYLVSDWDLASRMSYFLWASMPDDELLELARQGRLADPTILHQQVDRLLSDSKSQTLGTVFAAQWLGSQHLGVRIRPDPIDNPWCTDSLMESLKAETSLFFHSLVIDNEPIWRLVDADYTFLNEEVAAHYEIDGVEGSQMRRVALRDPNRGGIFGQGSLLAVTSFPGRTSPVVRGKWILSDVLGTPPPPPPPNVSEFSDEIADNRFLSPRQKLQMHRRNPNCYSCHSQIDPLGFSLENFDWFGRWRSESRGRPIDSAGTLPNGTEFSGPQGLRKVIVEQRMPDLVRQITQKMLSYALGRQLEYYDEPAVRKIIAATRDDDFRFRTLIRAVVESYPFQYKKNPSELTGN